MRKREREIEERKGFVEVRKGLPGDGKARAIKIYKATALDDAHFIIGALRVFFFV